MIDREMIAIKTDLLNEVRDRLREMNQERVNHPHPDWPEIQFENFIESLLRQGLRAMGLESVGTINELANALRDFLDHVEPDYFLYSDRAHAAYKNAEFLLKKLDRRRDSDPAH